jgi:hypothetical protein
MDENYNTTIFCFIDRVAELFSLLANFSSHPRIAFLESADLHTFTYILHLSSRLLSRTHFYSFRAHTVLDTLLSGVPSKAIREGEIFFHDAKPVPPHSDSHFLKKNIKKNIKREAEAMN